MQYVDQEDAFQLTLPGNWQQAEAMLEGNRSFQGSSGARRTIAWYPAGVGMQSAQQLLCLKLGWPLAQALASSRNLYYHCQPQGGHPCGRAGQQICYQMHAASVKA
jgi:hypothetical protein